MWVIPTYSMCICGNAGNIEELIDLNVLQCYISFKKRKLVILPLPSLLQINDQGEDIFILIIDEEMKWLEVGKCKNDIKYATNVLKVWLTYIVSTNRWKSMEESNTRRGTLCMHANETNEVITISWNNRKGKFPYKRQQFDPLNPWTKWGIVLFSESRIKSSCR